MRVPTVGIKMSYLRHTLLSLAAAVIATGCHAAPAAPPEPVQVKLGEAFTLAAGQDASVVAEALNLKFDQVLEDSRCPTRVNCFWTGEARLTVLVEQDGRAPVSVEFNTNPAPGQNKQEAKIGPYTIHLKSVDPYPETPTAIPFDDYRVVLLVNED